MGLFSNDMDNLLDSENEIFYLAFFFYNDQKDTVNISSMVIFILAMDNLSFASKNTFKHFATNDFTGFNRVSTLYISRLS